LTCVNAKDLDVSDLNQGDLQVLEISKESNDGLSTSETKLEISEVSNSAPTADEALSNSESKSDSQSQSYLILDNDADIENIYIGDYVTWIVSVINKGPDTAKT
jgi:hypothetical protein